ncbi:hypothetical protein ACMATS_06225 [Streptoverticillium reticulum]|uniref:hypothetical protein n=1 Tax=Streptoverticillium reticulum TaxID=1433415 RepID=UPI0039BFA155
MPVFPGTAMSGTVPHVEQEHERAAEAPDGARYRHAHGDTAIWPAHDFEVYWDLARAVPFPDRGPGQTR